MRTKKWEILSQFDKNIVDVLLKNRGIETKEEKKEFFSPTDPLFISIGQIGIDKLQLQSAIKRIKEAKNKKEKVIVYGDYDADGICATAILWEVLYAQKIDALPFIPNRFEDGYGIKPKSLEKLKEKYPGLGLVITVDNGIVAYEAVKTAKKLNVDVIISDHHTKGEKQIKPFSIIHTTKISGSAVAWFFAREIEFFFTKKNILTKTSLELAAIGTISDQLPLLKENRAIVKHGILVLRKTKRIGLKKIVEEAQILTENLGTYEIGFLIAPRINAMGRIGEGIDSLRLLCTKNELKALELAIIMGKTNLERQKLLDQVVLHAQTATTQIEINGILCLVGKDYHEGVIGLAASKLVEQFGRPAIVISKGEQVSKGSARSIKGVNITQILFDLSELLTEVGGHEMAAGFSIENKNLGEFQKRLEEMTAPILTEEILTKKVSIDMEIPFNLINWELSGELKEFEPTGIGNPTPLFASLEVGVIDKKLVGVEGKHLKLKVKQGDSVFDAIAFGFGYLSEKLEGNVDLAYNIDTNEWNGRKTLQLKVKDIKLIEENSNLA